MAEHENQHHLEFGGSPVGTEFDGSLHFELLYRIPHISVSQDFTDQTARQIRYALVGTVGPERPFYHRWQYVILDVRMIRDWMPGSGEFVGALRERLRKLGGELYLVTSTEVPVPPDVPRAATVEEAVEKLRQLRAENRARSLQVA